MRIPHYTATRFEQVITEGRTHPVIVACRSDQVNGPEHRLLVKAIGCPEITSSWQLVTETVGNTVARRMGVQTPVPAVVDLSDVMAEMVNRSLESEGHGFKVQAGPAAGCEFLPGLINFTIGQQLSTEQRNQAGKIFVFDMLSQNADRRPNKVNCALTKSGLIAFDFELSFAHKYLYIIGGSGILPWEPSKTNISKGQLFFEEVKANPPSEEEVELMIAGLTVEWWDALFEELPESWRADAERIGTDLSLVLSHSQDFAKDITTRCLI